MNFLDNLHFIKQQKNDLVTFFANNKVSIVKGPTGCGKSTYIPYILQNQSVVLVEPRRIAVKSIYNSLKDSIENLSYKMRFDSFTCAKLQNLKKSMKGNMKVTCECNKKTDTDKQNITDSECSGTHVDRCENTCKAYKKMLNTSNVEIVTDGIFLNNLNKYLTYEYIIIDEVHERSAKTDLILGILKQKLKNKLILMSATINTRIFEKYFDGKVFEIIGQSYKANIIYESVDDYIIGSFLKIKEIVSNENDKQNNKNSVHTNKHHKQLQVKNNDDEKNGTLIDKCNLQKSSTCSDNKDVDNVIDEIFDTKTPAEFDATNKNGDILVFLTGEEDINELYKLVRTIPQIKAYKIHSLLSDKKQNEIFEHTPLTKVILSTNICETSITIPGIKYVIDCGLAKEKIYNGCLHLGIKKIGKDNADQRKGRCNRTSDGVCYRLYEEDTYKKMVHSQPEIEKCDVSDIILILMYYNYNVFEFPFITFANMHNAKEAILYLLYIKAIEYKQDANTFTITRYGKKLVKNPVDTKLSHFLEICKNKKIKILGIALISIICQEQTDLLSIESRYESDIEEYLCVLQDYLNTDKNITNKFSSVQIRFLEKAKNIFVQLSKRKGFEYTKEELYELERAYSSAFSCNVLIRQDNGSYIGKMGTVYLFPTSNFYKKRIKKIVCVNVWNTKKCYAQFVGRFIED